MMKLAGLALMPFGLTLFLVERAALSRSTIPQTSRFAGRGAAASRVRRAPPLTNADIVKMVKGGLQESTILSVIAATDCDFDVSVDGFAGAEECRHQRQSHGCDVGGRCQETDHGCRHRDRRASSCVDPEL